MDMDALKPILAGLVRHGLTSLGGMLVASGYIKSSDVAGLVGTGMILAGVFWSWWQKEGQAKVLAALAKMHKMAPPTATTGQAAKVATDAAKAVASILLVAFALSAFLVPSAFAQSRPQLKLNLPIDPLHLNGAPVTGNATADMQALWQKIVASSLTDLNYAAAMAASANTTTSAVRLQCLKAIITLNEQASGANLKNPDGSPMAKPDPHMFTDVESLAEIVDNLSPQGPLFVGCSGAAQLAKTNVLTFVNAVVTGAAGFAAMPIIPGL